jgi:phosphatidylglycerophosphatase A
MADYVALALTTFGVGYIPGAPGTYGSVVGVAIYFGSKWAGSIALIFMYGGDGNVAPSTWAAIHAIVLALLTPFCLLGIWASGRTAPIFGRKDPSQAVVDEVMGQLITFCFVPFGIGWPFIVAGFLLFRFFDIRKPFPIRSLEVLPGGLGICADDIVAGVYAGICLAVAYAAYSFV